MKLTVEQRFWAKVNRLGPIPTHRPRLGRCWIWIGAQKGQPGKNYGAFGRKPNPVPIGAHVWSYINNIGPLPDGHWVLHKCDNRLCVRPSHLFSGTGRDNSLDMIAKGRRVKAFTYHRAPLRRLTLDDVQEIQYRYQTEIIRQADLAREYGVSQATISRITLIRK